MSLLIKQYLFYIASFLLLTSCATAPPHIPDTPAHRTNRVSHSLALYSKARMSALDGDYPNALNTLRKALENNPSSAFLYSAIGEIKLKIGQSQEALQYLLRAIELDPTYRPPFVMVGSLMAAALKDWEAADYLRKAIKLDPSKEDAYLHLSISLTRLFEYEEAVSTLKALIKLNSDSVLGYYYLGRTYSQMKLNRDAAGYFKKALELRPDFDQAAIDMAASYEALGEFPHAIEIYKNLVNNDDNKIFILQRLIQLLIQQRRYDEALNYLKSAADSGYGGPEIMRKIGLIYLELEKYDEAALTFEAMLSKDPSLNQIRLYLGIALEEKGELEKAMEQFIQIPSDAKTAYLEAVGHIAFIYKERGDVEKAVSTLQKAIELHPKELELYFKLASLYEALNHSDKGMTLLNDAEKIFPDDSRLQFQIGVIYDKHGKRTESIEMMKRALARNPKDPQALNFLGYSYAEMGINLNEALGYLQQAITLRPNDGFILDSLGWVYFKLKQYDEAVRYLEDAVALVEEDSTILEHLGDAYLARKEKGKALKTYKKALELEPERKELHKKIKHLKGEHNER